MRVLKDGEKQKAELYLSHHGILGMKWGIRRSPEQLARARGEIQESGNAKKAKIHAKLLESTDPKKLYDNRKQLSNAELQERLNRLNMEKNLATLAKEQDRKSYKKAKAFVKESISIAKTANEIYKIMQSPVGVSIARTLKAI